ncbi:manganese/zinc/iron transport system permease protein [Spirochaetota bacterium]|nr:manganese/zinc/iron transport system permease protein [Spirochaetota bacterium]
MQLAHLINFLTIEIIITALVITFTTALPGLFLGLQKKALLSDTTAHAVLLGIVISFMIVSDLNSPFLFIGASLAGVLAIALTELLRTAPFIKPDSAMVITFSLFFSLALILINLLGTDKVHLDEDAVILGELAFAPFVRTELPFLSFIPLIPPGTSLPTALVQALVILLLELGFVGLFYKELVMVSFDPLFTQTQGFKSRLVEFALVIAASLSAVNAIEHLGVFITIAFFVLPPATGLLLATRIWKIIAIATVFSFVTVPCGYLFSYLLNLSISGSMAFIMGITFLSLVFIKLFIKSLIPN